MTTASILGLLRVINMSAVIVGLVFATVEWRRMCWLLGALRDNQINGMRQLLAQVYVREAFLRVCVQGLLMIPAYLRLIENVQPDTQMRAARLAFGILAYMSVSVVLAWKAWMVYSRREQIADMLQERGSLRR